MICAECKGIRFKTCHVCDQQPNSFRDFRDYPASVQYDSQRDPRTEQRVPERPLQPLREKS